MANEKKNRKTALWILGWIFIFPIPLTILIARSRLKKPVKVICIILVWFFIVLLANLFGRTGSESQVETLSDGYISHSSVTTDMSSQSTMSTEENIDYKKEFMDSMQDNNIIFFDEVHNDITGMWKLCDVSSNEQVKDHAVEYYRGYFKDDNEVHAVINFRLKTTTRIVVNGVNLFVDVFEYKDGEENDAKELFSGMYYNSYIINKVTGEMSESSYNGFQQGTEAADTLSDVLNIILKRRIDSQNAYEFSIESDNIIIRIDLSQIYMATSDTDNKAFLMTVTIGDDFLEYTQFDDEWNTFTIIYPGFGRYTYTKDDILDSGGFGRFFNIREEDLIRE